MGLRRVPGFQVPDSDLRDFLAEGYERATKEDKGQKDLKNKG